MAALTARTDSADRIILSRPVAQRFSSFISLVAMACVGLSLFGNSLPNISDNPLLSILLLIFGVFILSALYNALASTTVVVDARARRATRTSSFLALPIRKVEVPFDRVRRVVVGSRFPVMMGQGGGRNYWQVALEQVEGSPLIVNWAGTHEEMARLGNRVANLMSRPLVDELERARGGAAMPELGPIQDFGGGTGRSGLPPVAMPGPFGGSRPASQLPEKEPPPNVLMPDAVSEEHARFEEQAAEAPSAPPPTAPPIDTGMPPLYSGPLIPSPPPASVSQAPTSPEPSSSAGTGSIFTSLPPLESMGQAPIGTASAVPSETERPSLPSFESEMATRPARRRSREELQQALAENPNDAEALYQLGRIWLEQRGWDQAREAFESAAHLDPLNGLVQNDLGVLFLLRGNYREAEASLRRAIGLDPFSGRAHYNLGLLLLRTGRRPQAAVEFDLAAQNAASDSESRLFSGAAGGVPGDPLLSSPG